jgi:hypothetical protein
MIVRLFNPTSQPTSVSLRSSSNGLLSTELCDLTGCPLQQLKQPIALAAYQFVTVRAGIREPGTD